MGGVFLRILDMSLIASYVILCVIIIRFFIRRAEKKYSYMLWSIVFIRLICPISFESKMSIVPNLGEENFGVVVQERVDKGFAGAEGLIIDVENEREKIGISRWDIIVGVWGAVGLAMIIWNFKKYRKLKKVLGDSVVLEDGVYINNSINTSFVFGVLEPKIYISGNLKEKEREYILLHEKIHVKRKDYLIKFLAYGVLCIYWFNPLVWITFILMSKDMEMSCDEKVIQVLGKGIKKDYSKSLLEGAKKENILLSPIGFGNNDTKDRIKNLLNYKKPKFYVSILVIILLMSSGIMLLSNEYREENLTSREEKIEGNMVDKDIVTGLEKKDTASNIKNYFEVKGKKIKNYTKVPEYDYKGDDLATKLVFETEKKKNSPQYEGGIRIIEPIIYGMYEEENLIKVIAVVNDLEYILGENMVYSTCGGIIPVAITYEKKEDNTYKVVKYEQCLSGSEYAPSIEEFCTMPVSGRKIKGLAKKVIEGSSGFSDVENLNSNEKILQKHLKDNGVLNTSYLMYEYPEDKIVKFT